MIRCIFVLCLVLEGMCSFSQQQYFVYIQAAERQPFYAKIDSKIYSSSENGYLIIPKLSDSVYQITIGFAKAAYPEQQFPVGINKKDNGFELKNFGEKGWGLFNLQTMAVVMNESNSSQSTSSAVGGEKKTDAFSELLANVVNDSAILYSPAKAKAPEPVTGKNAGRPGDVTIAASEKKAAGVPQAPAPTPAEPVTVPEDTAAEKANVPVTGSLTTDPLFDSTATKNAANSADPMDPVKEASVITKSREHRSDSAYSATFLERHDLVNDTIRILIPLADAPDKQVPSSPSMPASSVKQNSAPAPAQAERKAAIVVINSDCRNFASGNDVDKLRVRLMATETIDDKLAASRKVFRSRCFTVMQLRALSELFPSDETKFRFFETSYPFVSDAGNFAFLEETFTTDLFRKRFKELIQK